MHTYDDYSHLIFFAIRPFFQTVTKTKMTYGITIDDLYQIASIRLWLTLPKINPSFQPKQINRYLIRCMYVDCLFYLKKQRQVISYTQAYAGYTHEFHDLISSFTRQEKMVFHALLQQMTLMEIAHAFSLTYKKVYGIKTRIQKRTRLYFSENKHQFLYAL